MSAKETPLQQMKRLHGSRDKLIDAVTSAHGVVDSEDGEEAKARFAGLSNRKLLRILNVTNNVKSKYGTKEKLAETVATATGKGKDKDYIGKLQGYSLPHLCDMAAVAERRNKRKAA